MEDDGEAPAGLPGAEFALYRDLGTVGSLDDADVLVPPLDDPDGDGDTVTGADGLARWGEIRPGELPRGRGHRACRLRPARPRT